MTPSGHPVSSPRGNKQDRRLPDLTSQLTGSLIQSWERREDIQSSHPHVDITDAWSSDGGSVSSSSCGSDQPGSGQEDGTHDVGSQPGDRTNSYADIEEKFQTSSHFLKRARIFTSEEAINQAIDRWQAYIRLCTRALGRLRQQLVDSYVPFALEQHRIEASEKSNVIRGGFPSDEISQPTEGLRSCSRRKKALRNMLRHSIKVANQRHQACVSKFALVSNRLAKWRKPASTPRCRYRDPTTTTWENTCSNQCLPLLPVCAHHLVQLSPAPQTATCDAGDCSMQPVCELTPSSASVTDVIEVVNTHSDAKEKNTEHAYNRIGGKKVTTNRTVRISTSEIPTTTSLNTGVPELQIPTQYLLRQCGGGDSGRPCSEPVISWSPDARCIQHANCASVCGARSLLWSRTKLSQVPIAQQAGPLPIDPACPFDMHSAILSAIHSDSTVKTEPN